MPTQQKTKHLCRHDYKNIIEKDCEMVVVIKKEIESYADLFDDSGSGEKSKERYGPRDTPSKRREAYWLWRGCQLLRPVFDMKREKKAYEIRKYMTTIAKISAAQAREHLYKQELKKLHNGVLPEDIVCYIAEYTWDIMLLLK